MPKHNVAVQLSGENGNAFAIMGRVAEALRQAGVSEDEITQYRDDSMSGDYDHLLQVAMEWVEVH